VSARLAVVQRLVAAWSAGWVVVRWAYLQDLAGLPDRRWAPIGALATVDGPPSRALVTAALAAVVVLGALLAVGRAPRWAVPVWAAAVLLVSTFASSWGQVFHTENLLALHAIVLAAAAVLPRPDPDVVLRALAVVTVTTYVVAGVAKLRDGGLEWLTGDVLRHQVAFDNARKAVVGGATSPLGTRLVDHAWLWPPLAAGALVVELGAPLALLHRRLATAWVAAAWAFHAGVLALMAIGFPYQLALVAFAPLLPVERLRFLAPNSEPNSEPTSEPNSEPATPATRIRVPRVAGSAGGAR
jgi:hypothetical protein